MGNLIDETGNKYGYLTVIERADNIITPNGRSHVAWKCQCECGNIAIIRGSCLRNGHTKSCGCHKQGGRAINEEGNKYGRLTVLKRIGSDNDKKVLWLCQCECGNTTITTGKRLRNGMVKSCGCLKSFKESDICLLLDENKIKYKREFKFLDLYDKGYLRFDFAIINNNQVIGLIEYNGEQHYLTNERGRYTFENINKIKLHDTMKINYCQENNIPLLILNKDNYDETKILQWIYTLNRESEGGKPLCK